MEVSERFNEVKSYFDHKVWNEKKVRNAVKMNWITESEFLTITGIAY